MMSIPEEGVMSSSAFTPQPGGPALATSESAAVERDLAGLWWLWLVTGVAWIIASFVVLQFDAASITTIGIIVGCMLVFAGIQQMFLAAAADSFRWLWAIFGVLFLIAGFVCFFNPEETFAGLADILGFVFLVIGIWWIIEAFVTKSVNPLWWLGLISGILMIVLAFWTSGQFFFEKAYTLLVMAGIWALMRGVIDIVRAFQVRSLRS
jgi:hypothetical protein